MIIDDNDGQMIFGDLGGLKLPDICLAGEEKPQKNLTQETCPDQGSNPGPLRDKRACYHLLHSGGLYTVPYISLSPAQLKADCPAGRLHCPGFSAPAFLAPFFGQQEVVAALKI